MAADIIQEARSPPPNRPPHGRRNIALSQERAFIPPLRLGWQNRAVIMWNYWYKQTDEQSLHLVHVIYIPIILWKNRPQSIVARFFTTPTFFWTFHWMDDGTRVRFLLRLVKTGGGPARGFRAAGCSVPSSNQPGSKTGISSITESQWDVTPPRPGAHQLSS